MWRSQVGLSRLTRGPCSGDRASLAGLALAAAGHALGRSLGLPSGKTEAICKAKATGGPRVNLRRLTLRRMTAAAEAGHCGPHRWGQLPELDQEDME